MTTYNRTSFTLDDIQQMKELKFIQNLWRRRNVVLHQHPSDENKIISVGTCFDANKQGEIDIIIAVESKKDFRRELNNPHFFVTTE